MGTTLTFFVIALLALIAAGFCWNRDVRRRKLRFNLTSGRSLLLFLDVATVSAGVGLAFALLMLAPHDAPSNILFTPASLAAAASVVALLFLWAEGKRQVQLQRPAGIVFAEGLLLFGIYEALSAAIFHAAWNATRAASISLPILAGSIVLASILPTFLKGHEEHRILDRIDSVGEYTQSEYVAPTPECPYPDRWHMLDSQSAEAEILDFLKSFIVTVKPELVLETGTFIGHSSMKMAEGMRENGFGKIVTIEYDPVVFAKAKQNIDASGLGEWIEYRNASSLDTVVEGTIDILFSDSDLNIRESEIRRFLPQIKPRGLVLVHDASSTFKVVREAVLRLEQEGLLSVVLLSTPRGMVIAQKREGRS
jgi:predicted O-methyltransferase YrrM